jgi:fumarate hydratase class II
MMLMVCAQVQGNDLSVSLGGLGGRFELNTMMPLMAHNILQSIDILGRAVTSFTGGCIEGLEADEERCEAMVERSLALVTSLAPALGYDTAAEIAHEAYSTGRTVRDICTERKLFSESELDHILDARRMTGD